MTDSSFTPEFLPEPLPADPFAVFRDWFRAACEQRVQPNPDAMVLATTGDDARPSARVVLCKQLVAHPGYLVFYTNYESRKAGELAMHPRAAAVLYWDVLHRQVRVEGPVVRSPAAESDAYFASRGMASQIGAWASRQSRPLSSRAELAAQVAAASRRFAGAEVPRPPQWGGFRLWPDAVELWVEGPGRVHDRARWQRTLTPDGDFAFACGTWQAARLNP